VFEDGVLRRIFEPKLEEVTRPHKTAIYIIGAVKSRMMKWA
jgi:hypothetical protein